jgi:hypothetical protein
VRTNSGVLSWQTAGYFEIIALNAPASSKKRMFASGQLQHIDERPDDWPVFDGFAYEGYKI